MLSRLKDQAATTADTLRRQYFECALRERVLTKFLHDRKVPSSEPGRVATAHGVRSSFRDWASENGYARDLAERALSHTISNQAEAAYHRTDLLEQRRAMMEAWSAHVEGLVGA